MKYSLLVSMIYYLCGFFYMGFGSYALDTNARSRINQLFILVTSSTAIWAFSFAIANSAPTAEASVFWGCVSVFGWGVFYSIMLHFMLILTKAKYPFRKWIVHTLIYLPAVINIILFAPFGYLAEKQFQLIPTDFGWRNVLPTNLGNFWFIGYYSIFTIVIFVLLIRWWKSLDSQDPQKPQATKFLLSLFVPLILGVATETIPDILGKGDFPEFTVIYLMAPIIVLSSTLRRSGLLLERPAEVYVPLKSEQFIDADRFRLFRTVASIFIVGSSLSFFIGYFALKRPLRGEAYLAISLLLLGIFIRHIPRITKNHNHQSTMFLAAGTYSLVLLILRNVETGASTIWSIYILFFMFTVILDSKIHLTIYAALVVLIQIFIAIIYPEVPVVIDANAYVTRITLIILTYFAVRRVADEYALKLNAHKQFIKEQHALEAISTNFITITSDNAKEKVDEMLEMSVEVLEFDYAYLIGFRETDEEGNVFSTYPKNIESDLLPFHAGMKVKMDDLPMAKILAAKGTPMMCEDIVNSSFDECEGTRDFLISRGIVSFFAYPLQIEGRPIEGMLVFEYYNQSDINLRENRFHFLNMMVNVLGDARKKTLYEEILHEVAYFDEATKLGNRSLLAKTLQESINENEEFGKIAAINLEFSNMRMIKDTYGHTMVDQVMLKSAAIIKDLLDDSCTITRTNYGEFGIVSPNIESVEQLENCVNRLIAAFSHPISTDLEIEALFVVPHIGVAVYPDDGMDVRTIMKNADLAGYEAVRNNEDFVFYAERLEDSIAENTFLTNKLFRSMENEEFSLEFQPQISCTTGKTVGIEALLRWTTDDNKRIPPDRFIPILEQTGIIYDVGLWVLEQALQEHNRLVANGFPPLRVSVNLSMVQFEWDEFVSDVAKIIEASRVDPQYIEMEITESLFSKNPEDMLRKLHELKELGVRITIDDFGKGYSSLNRLKLVPFDRVKIDKEIIDYIDVERKWAPITQHTISLARSYGAKVTAEGVETKGQADFLKNLNCDEIQGYYYSRPLPPKVLEEFLAKGMV